MPSGNNIPDSFLPADAYNLDMFNSESELGYFRLG
jgi:hypothetical protein